MGFLKGDTGDDREITEAFLRLRKHCIRDLSTDYLDNSKVVWKAKSTYQCLIRRTIDAVEGMRAAWNAGNLLTALTMGRSLIEIGAVVRRLSDSVKEATEKHDVEALDAVIMNVGFATRVEEFQGEDEEFKALNILTVIERMDRSIFKDKRSRLLSSYEFLSEFVHPNHLGILGLYSDSFVDEYRIEFGRTARKKEHVLSQLRISLGMIWLVEQAASDFEFLVLPEMLKFVPR
jgi:hypothetical protein